ncbi:MAG: LPS assembly protein LptD [Thiotrichaceae bacterium]
MTEFSPDRPVLSPIEDENIHLVADEGVILEKQGIATFTGNVLLQRFDQILQTDHLVYNRNTDEVTTKDNFTFWDKNYVIKGNQLHLAKNQQGDMQQATYWLLNWRGHGQADKVIQQNQNIINLENSTYTTCDPENIVWHIKAATTELNKAEGVGVSRDASLRLFDIPIFYTPYLSYPLNNQRKSGFLPPSIGNSDQVGAELSLPYYFNLNPSYDATLTTRLMSRRGVALKGQFRYLLDEHTGQWDAEYSPYDRSYGGSRSSIALKHTGKLATHWITDINFNQVSDRRYFEDLGNTLSVASLSHLEQRADALYSGVGWNFLTRVQKFQTLDPNPAARPYYRLPQLLLKTTLPVKNRQFNMAATAELVRFDRDTDIIPSPVGNRLDVNTIFSYPYRTAGTFIIPKLSLRHTQYQLDNQDATVKDSLSRSLFTISLDSGLFFERDVHWFDNNLLQTLEPRIFYRYTPRRTQTDIPIFDTAEYDLSFNQLFRDNRFSGADRVDDGHQVTFALTSRLAQQHDGTELLRASVGQIYYLSDLTVNLPNQPIETNNSSSIVTELASQYHAWQAQATWRWNPHAGDTEYSALRLRYHPDSEHIINFGYRLRKNSLEQTDISFYYPLHPQWRMLGRWNYSLQDHKDVEILAGLEYESCCWAIRTVFRRYINPLTDRSYSNGIFLEFEFKGLGSVGKKAKDLLCMKVFLAFATNFLEYPLFHGNCVCSRRGVATFA